VLDFFLKKSVRLSLHHPKLVLVLFLLVLFLAFLITGRVRFETDWWRLLPMDRGALKIFAEDLRGFGHLERLYILLEGEGATELIETAQRLRKSLFELEIGGEKAFRRVYWGMESNVQEWEGILTLYLYHPQLYLHEEEVEKFKGKLAEENILKEIHKTKGLLMSYLSPGWRYLIPNDPIALREFFFTKWKGNSSWTPSLIEGYLISPNGKALLMMAEPSFPSDAWRFSHELVHRLEELKGAFLRVRVSFVGPHTMMVGNAGILRQDLLISFLCSFVVVMMLFYLSYRRIVTLLFVGLPLLVGVQLTMGVASLFTRGLNLITVSFAAIIVGLGVDFAIHIYHRYHHERAAGIGLDEALEIALTRTGKGVWTGGLTTIASFLTLLLARIQGIVELGILVAAGLFFCLMATSLVLPSFLVWVERGGYHYKPLEEWGLDHLIYFIKANYSKILIVLFSLTVIGVFIGTKVKIIGGVEGMRPRGVEGMKILERIREQFGGEGRGMTVLLQGEQLNQLLREEETIASSLHNEYGEGIRSISHLAQFIPSTDRQEMILEMLRKDIDYEKTKRSLERALESEGMSPDAFALTLEMLSRMAHAETSILPEALVERLSLTPLADVIKRYVAQEEGGYKLRQEIRFDPEKVDPLKLEKVIKRITPRAQCTGIELIAHQLQGMVKRDFTILAPLALFLVIILLFLHFTRPLWVGMTLTPLLAGVAYLLGASYLLGMELNPANAIAIPLIIGIGIDDGIHIVHRYREEGDVGGAVKYTGRAVIMTSLTTMVGFGSLSTSHFPALSSLGKLSIMGIGSCLLTSLLLLPSLLEVIHKKD
jgi:predicted RND superfamily exporter protein